MPTGTKYHIFTEYHSVCPLVGIGTLPPPLSLASVPLPPGPKGERAHSPAGEGLGEFQFRRLEKKLSTLPTLCPQVNKKPQSTKQSARLFLKLSELESPPPHPQASLSPPPWVKGTHTEEGRGVGVPIPTRGQPLWYSRYKANKMQNIIVFEYVY